MTSTLRAVIVTATSYEMRDAIVDPGHLCIENIQNGYKDECTHGQCIETTLNEGCGLALEKVRGYGLFFLPKTLPQCTRIGDLHMVGSGVIRLFLTSAALQIF